MSTDLDPKSKDESGLTHRPGTAGPVPFSGKERRRVIMIATVPEGVSERRGPAATLDAEELLLHDPVTDLETVVHRRGTGVPLVILNGLLGLNKHWFGVLGPVSGCATCVLVEPPLLRLTGEQCSVRGVVRMVTDALQRLDLGPAVLAGNSLGGHVAMRIALERPDLCRGLVLMGSSGLFERSFERDVMHSPSKAWLDRKIGDLFADRRRMPTGMVDEAYDELRHRKSARALVKLGKSAKNDHLGQEIPRLRVPTLLVWGRQDNVTPPEVATEFNALITGSRLEWIESCGHAPQLERPDEVARHLCAFIRGLDAGRI